MEKLFLKKIKDDIENIFIENYEDEIIFFLCDTKFSNVFIRNNKFREKIISRIQIEKELEINGILKKDIAIITFDALTESEKDFVIDVISSVYYNKDNLVKEIGEIYEMLTAMIIGIKINDLVEKKKQIGLIGEILTLIQLNQYDENIAKKLVGDSKARFDISINEEFKIEVKTTTQESREHTIKINQLKDRDDIYISSVKLEKDSDGFDLSSLSKKYSEIIKLIPIEKRFEIMEFCELVKNSKNEIVKFNLERSIENIKYYNAKDILKSIIKDGKYTKISKITLYLNEDEFLVPEDIFGIDNKET